MAIPLKKEGFLFFQLYFLFDEIALIRLYLFFPPASQVGSGGGSRPRLALVTISFYIMYHEMFFMTIHVKF